MPDIFGYQINVSELVGVGFNFRTGAVIDIKLIIQFFMRTERL